MDWLINQSEGLFLRLVELNTKSMVVHGSLKTLAKSITHHMHYHPHPLFSISIFSINHTHCSHWFHHLIHANPFSLPCTWSPPFSFLHHSYSLNLSLYPPYFIHFHTIPTTSNPSFIPPILHTHWSLMILSFIRSKQNL